MNLKDKKVLVTGSAIRVGAEIVKAFAHSNCQIFIHCNKSIDEATSLANSINHAKVIQADLNVQSDLEKLRELIEKNDIDILVNNASIYEHFNLSDNSQTAIDKHMQINYLAPKTLINQMAINAEKSSKERVVINILDQILLSDKKSDGAYYQSRKVLLDNSLQWAKLYGNLNLRINNIAPGPMIAPTILSNKSMQKTIPTLPLKRAVNLEDVTDSAIFLAKNSSITGAVLAVDCGEHLI